MYVTKANLSEVFSQYNNEKPLFFDTETLGLHGRTRLVQIRQDNTHHEIDCFYTSIEDIKYYLKGFHLVGHNIGYDLSCDDFKRWWPKKVDDTLLLSRMQFAQLESHSLASLAKELDLGVDKTDEGKSDWSNWHLSDAQLEYAANDTLLVKNLYEKFIEEHWFSSKAYILNIESLRLAMFYQHQGMVVDKAAARKFQRDLNKELAAIGLPEELNVNSSKQVCEFLQVESSSKEALTALNTPIANKILTKRQTLKALSYVEELSQFDRVYTYISPFAAKTGRFTSRGGELASNKDYFNLQQIPRNLKSLFGVKKPSLYVTADYPALEIWMVAALIGDEFLVKALRDGVDLHYATAAKMYNMPIEQCTKRERFVSKMCNFTLLYGAGARLLGEAISALDNGSYKDLAPKAGELRQAWLNTYKGIAQWHKEVFKHFEKNKTLTVYTPLGLPMCARTPMEALNFSVQGGGAECTKLAIYYLEKQGIPIVNTVHDSIALIAPNESIALEWKEALEDAMERGYKTVAAECKVSDLPLKVKAEVGESYS